MINHDQIASDNNFYTQQLQARACVLLGLECDNTSWFEIVGEMEKAFEALKLEVSELQDEVSDVSQQAYEAGLMDGANQ